MTLVSVVGAGGLLGRALSEAAARRGAGLVRFTGLDWRAPRLAAAAIAEGSRGALSAGPPPRWTVVWCAGIGGVGADEHGLDVETDLLRRTVHAVRALADGHAIPTVFSFASSAGAVWSGSRVATLSEGSPPAPWHDYGRAKLAQERAVAEEVRGSPHLRARLARISNLYGAQPWQHAPKGLVGHLVGNALKRVPTPIYVPLDTQRDYIHVDHAAGMMLADAWCSFDRRAGSVGVDLVASGQSHTIAAVTATLSHVLQRRVALIVGYSALAARQPRILAFRSACRDLAALNPTSLPDGIRRVVNGQLAGTARA
ncbi:MAG TPA: NAD(P)-dependent oxidoreductase [Egibacteraceae bacterium]|nr:NAD(P)-dependent oxidoreductase [Egibacteraceae bacterium]